MLKTSVIIWLLGLRMAVCSCIPETKNQSFEKAKYKVEQVGTLPKVVGESSGLATASGKPTFWTHNDSGNAAELYEITTSGELVSTLKMPNISNQDWEDISRDERGNLYIGDIGNNAQNRQDMAVYKISENREIIEKIGFTFPDQPEKVSKKNRRFDCEAFFFANDSLYFFSKNRGKNHNVHLYAVPARAGQHTAQVQDTFRIAMPVTAADISPDRRSFALMTYGKILWFGIENGQINFKKPLYCLKINHKQTEALVFLNNTDLLISNEQRQLFRVSKK